jgi:hypothetical protein
MNKMCNFASCWIYTGIVLGVHLLLHISRIRVNLTNEMMVVTKINRNKVPDSGHIMTAS